MSQSVDQKQQIDVLGIDKITLQIFSAGIEQIVEVPLTATGNCVNHVVILFQRLFLLSSCVLHFCSPLLIVLPFYLSVMLFFWLTHGNVCTSSYSHHLSITLESLLKKQVTSQGFIEMKSKGIIYNIVIFYKLIFWFSVRQKKHISSWIFIKDFVKVSEC